MSDYRLYCQDGTGTISLAEWIKAQDDEDAIQQARSHKSAVRKCEVWQGNRLVASLDASELEATTENHLSATVVGIGGSSAVPPID
jgi:hypothetical protein